MAWNKGLPTVGTKLRLTPSILQANNEAVEEGGVPFDFLSMSDQVADPAREDDTGKIYGKAVSGISELFFLDDDAVANIKQLTGLDVNTTVIAAGGTNPGGTVFGFKTPWGVTVSWGTSNAHTGTLAFFDVTFPVAFTNAPVVMKGHSTSGGDVQSITNVTNTSCRVTGSNTFTSSFFAFGV